MGGFGKEVIRDLKLKKKNIYFIDVFWYINKNKTVLEKIKSFYHICALKTQYLHYYRDQAYINYIKN